MTEASAEDAATIRAPDDAALRNGEESCARGRVRLVPLLAGLQASRADETDADDPAPPDRDAPTTRKKHA